MSSSHIDQARRRRSRSIVQAIAFKVPEVPSHVDLGDNVSDSASQLQGKKAHSIHNLLGLYHNEAQDVIAAHGKAPQTLNKNFNISHNNYPLSKHESDSLWDRYQQSFEYNVLILDDAENALFNKRNAKYLNFQNDMLLKHSQNELIIEKIDNLLGSINSLNSKYQTITNDTRIFQDQSNQLISEHDELMDFHKQLSESLSHFENLNEINAFLNKPGLNRVIKSSKFLHILQKLDRSLKFINENSDFKDAESYSALLKASLTKALTLIKNYINNSLNNTYNTITNQLNNLNDPSSITANALLYTKFEMTSEEINRFMLILYEKQDLYNGEYEGLLSDVFGTYFSIRSKLLNQTLKANFNANVVLNKSLIQFFQDNLSFYINLINNEYELFYKFFNEFRLSKFHQQSGETKDVYKSITDQSLNFDDTLNSRNLSSSDKQSNDFYDDANDEYLHDPEFNFFDFLQFASNEFFQWIESSILDTLYDILRNKILKEQEIKILCHLITLLQKYYDDGYDEDIDEDFMDRNQDFSKFHINFARLFNPILTDIQSRLVFKVQIFIDENIIKYRPKLDDLPLSNKKSDTQAEVLNLNGELDFNNDEYYKGWYPTLKTSITLLSQIHQLVNSAIFDDLAHNIIHLCIASLKKAFDFSLKYSGPKDSKLFLMKNLLILKKNVEHFDIDFTSYNDVDFDFSGMKELFNKFRTGTVWSDAKGGLIEIAKDSVPKIVTNMYDAKMELQLELRNIVHSFIETIVLEITTPLINKPADQSIAETMTIFKNTIYAELEGLKGLLVLYMDDTLVVSYLLDGIKELLIQNYELFYNKTVERISRDSEPNKEQLNDLMETDILINYLSDTSAKFFGYAADNVTHNDTDSLDVGMIQDISDIESIGEDMDELSQSLNKQAL